MFKGLQYRNNSIYNGLTFLKLLGDYDRRFHIARRYIRPGDVVLDVCSGDGRLSEFLPEGCAYHSIEASPVFQRCLSKKGLRFTARNLNEGLGLDHSRFDVVMMIISLCHFERPAIDRLLEQFKAIGRRVVIIEDVLPYKYLDRTFRRRVMNHLCATDYSDHLELLTYDEFAAILKQHGYALEPYDRRYFVGTFVNA